MVFDDHMKQGRAKLGDSMNNPWNGIQGGSDSRSMEALKPSKGDVGMNGGERMGSDDLAAKVRTKLHEGRSWLLCAKFPSS